MYFKQKLRKTSQKSKSTYIFLTKKTPQLQITSKTSFLKLPSFFYFSPSKPRIPGIQTLSASLWLDLDGFQNGGAVWGTQGMADFLPPWFFKGWCLIK